MIEYAVAETFHSIQGEGTYTGTQMFFIRLAGCNVGEYSSASSWLKLPDKDFTLLANKEHSICTSVLGEKFLCDTNYHASERRSVKSLMDEVNEDHICITGGEPFLHDLEPLVEAAQKLPVMTHIETSGTKPMVINLTGSRGYVDARKLWITCSPKTGFLDDNIDIPDEWKFLVGPDFDVNAFKTFTLRIPSQVPIYLQPINNVNTMNKENMEKCLKLVKEMPGLRVSTQLHKWLGVR